jgi:hypothetical protein
MNPDWHFEGRALKKSHPLKQCLSKPLLKETPEKKVGTHENEKKCE